VWNFAWTISPSRKVKTMPYLPDTTSMPV